METKLTRIKERSIQNPTEVFTSLGHLINEELLVLCHQEIDGHKATGIDQVTKAQYEENLTDNIHQIVEKLKQKAYRPQPVKRVYIPKGDGKQVRPLGIATYEDKLVQLALKKILEAVFEPHFLDHSYGFRPNRNAHEALKALSTCIEKGKVGYIVDADIQGFFDHVDHEKLIECVQKRIQDPNIIRLIRRFLIAGIMENGHWESSDEGVQQGSSCSPLLANIYLHYGLDLWFERAVKPNMHGEAYIIRYSDDFVCGFQHKDDAENFYKALQHQLAKFSLSIQREKSKIIQFGRFAEKDRTLNGLEKPETFDFLGFTHYCSLGRYGNFRVKRKTSRKKFSKKVKEVNLWVKEHRHMELKELMKTVKVKLIGHYRYYGVTDNSEMMGKYYNEVQKSLFKWLNRRSQKRSFTYDQFNQYRKRYPLPHPKIYFSVYA